MNKEQVKRKITEHLQQFRNKPEGIEGVQLKSIVYAVYDGYEIAKDGNLQELEEELRGVLLEMVETVECTFDTRHTGISRWRLRK